MLTSSAKPTKRLQEEGVHVVLGEEGRPKGEYLPFFAGLFVEDGVGDVVQEVHDAFGGQGKLVNEPGSCGS